MKKIVFCGGGTAGHVMPNIAILEKLLKHNIEIHYIGGSGIEKQILKKYSKIIYHEISCPKLIRKLTLKNLTIPFKLLKAINTCKSLLREIKPSVIFSKGGFISVPVVMSAKNIPVLSHESDYSMGLANKIIYHYTDKMYFSFEDTASKYLKKGVFCGTPIRQEIFSGNKSLVKKKLNILNNNPNILVVGGSCGAKAINDFIFNNIHTLTKKYNIIHITGKQTNNNIDKLTIPNYHPIEFVDDMGNYLALADFVISRAGSNAIFEFLALKKPMVLIPLPKDESRGDQVENAKYFFNKGFAETIQQKELTVDILNEKLNKLKNNKSYYIENMNKAYVKNATDIIYKDIMQYLK